MRDLCKCRRGVTPGVVLGVYMGTMTWEEMMFPFFSVVVDKGVDPRKVIRVRVAAPDGA